MNSYRSDADQLLRVLDAAVRNGDVRGLDDCDCVEDILVALMGRTAWGNVHEVLGTFMLHGAFIAPDAPFPELIDEWHARAVIGEVYMRLTRPLPSKPSAKFIDIYAPHVLDQPGVRVWYQNVCTKAGAIPLRVGRKGGFDLPRRCPAAVADVLRRELVGLRQGRIRVRLCDAIPLFEIDPEFTVSEVYDPWDYFP